MGVPMSILLFMVLGFPPSNGFLWYWYGARGLVVCLDMAALSVLAIVVAVGWWKFGLGD